MRTVRRRRELLEGDAKVAMVHSMFDEIADRYELLNTVMTFGLDRKWRRVCIERLGLPRGSHIVDLACGTGDLADGLTAVGQRVVGVDLSLAMLQHAKRRSLCVIEGDGSLLPFPGRSFDGVVCGFAVRNFADIEAVFRAVAEVLRPGGRFVILEIDTPSSRVLRFGQRAWLGLGVPLLGMAFSKASAYRYLPRSVAYLPSQATMTSMLTHAGFEEIEKVTLSGGITQLVSATRRANG